MIFAIGFILFVGFLSQVGEWFGGDIESDTGIFGDDNYLAKEDAKGLFGED